MIKPTVKLIVIKSTDMAKHDKKNAFRQSKPESNAKGLWLYGYHPVVAALQNPRRTVLRSPVPGASHRHTPSWCFVVTIT